MNKKYIFNLKIKSGWNLILFLRAMKITVALLLVVICQGFASVGFSQKQVSLNLRNVKLEKALDEIEKQSDLYFVFNQKLVDVTRIVNLSVKHKDIKEVLDELFVGVDVNYKVLDKQILLAPGKFIYPVNNEVAQKQIKISGVVLDTKGITIPGVTIKIKGSSIGVTTDGAGKFSLNVPSEKTILTISCVGYNSQEILIGNQQQLTVVLQEDIKQLEEVVVVGYGVQKKVNLTGAVSQVSFNKIESRPISNVGQALQGAIPNLNVTISDGSPNTTPQLNVRGGTSFSGGSFVTGSPLILVDGIEMDINQLNPEDIDNISVLKDASSAAIYGSRAAFGVMLVTTKKGSKNEKAKITYDNSFQWNTPTAIPNLLDNYTIQDAANKALLLENKSVSSDQLTRLDMIKAYNADPKNVAPYYVLGGNLNWIGNTDVYGLAIRHSSPMQKQNISLSGGSEKSSYYGSIGYQSQDGLYKINTDKYTRYNALVKVSSEISKWLSIDLKSAYNYSKYTEPVSPAGKGGWWTAMSQDPTRNINMPMKTPANSPVGEMYTDNILSFMDYGSSDAHTTENVILGASPTITLSKNWKIKGDFSFRTENDNEKQFVPELSRIEFNWANPTTVYTSPSYVQVWKDHANQYTINAYTDYAFTLKKHNFYALAGFNQEWYNYDHLDGRGENLISPQIPYMSQTLGNQYAVDHGSEWATRGAFYRFTYNFNEKYLFESNGRYDGTSRFPKNDRFKFYPSFSGAWRVTKENFAKVITPVVTDLKLRASYGSLGNQNVSNYIYVPTYTTISQENQLFNGLRGVGIVAPALVSPTLTWETASTLDFGCDVTLWKKLDFTYDWYNRTTSDILVAGDKFPAVLGASAPTKNSGELRTIGWELTAKWKDRLKNGLSYDIAFSLSDYQSKIVSFNGNPNKLLSTLYAGQNMGEIWGYQTVGTFQTQAQVAAAPSQSLLYSGVWYPGDVQYKDLNGDGKISPGASTLADPGDKKVIGNSTPRYQFGLNMNASYKGFDLNIFFQGVGKRDYWIGNNLYWGLISASNATGTWDVYNNSWTPDRTNAFYPAYKTKAANIQTQTKYLQNAAYIRLKNLTLGYTLPKKLTRTAGIDHLRVYVSTYNIWQYSKLPSIYDPELLTGSYPMIKSIAFGLQVSL
jgi:TonB-linked SusC/RagA family outer membrane protein